MDIIGGLIYLENEITNKVTNEIIKQTLKSIRIGRSQKSAVNFRKFWGSLLLCLIWMIGMKNWRIFGKIL